MPTPLPPLLLSASLLTLSACAAPAPSPRAQSVAQNPAELLAILASPTTPTDSRQSADRLLVQQKGPREPARLAVLEQILYAPGHAAAMRIYALDALADADPARAGQTLILYLPQLQNEGPEWNGVLAHACATAVKLGDDRVIESLIRSMHRLDTAPLSAWQSRPEWPALQTLANRPIPDILYRVIAQSRDRSARVAALDILQQLDTPAAVIQHLQAMPGDDLWLTDLRWWLTQFHTLPIGESESLWMEYLHRPEQAALVARAQVRDHTLRRQAADYVFAPRFIAVLAAADDATLALSREALLADLHATLAALPHAPAQLPATTLAANEKKLTRADLLTLQLLLHNLAAPRIIDELLRQGLDDLSDTTSAHGGLLTFATPDAPLLIPTLFPPLDSASDDDYLPSDSLLQKTATGLAQYHFNFQQIHNAPRTLPTETDLRRAHLARCNNLLITSITTRTIDCVYYTPTGLTLDLGLYTSK